MAGQQDNIERIINDLMADLAMVVGTRTTHEQLKSIEEHYRKRAEKLKKP